MPISKDAEIPVKRSLERPSSPGSHICAENLKARLQNVNVGTKEMVSHGTAQMKTLMKLKIENSWNK